MEGHFRAKHPWVTLRDLIAQLKELLENMATSSVKPSWPTVLVFWNGSDWTKQSGEVRPLSPNGPANVEEVACFLGALRRCPRHRLCTGVALGAFASARSH